MAGPWEKYQQSPQVQDSGKPWEKYQPAPMAVQAPVPALAESRAPETDETAAAGLQGFGQGGTLGYLPQAQAGFGFAVERANEALGGTKATDYSDLLAHFQKRNERLKEENPIATGVGNVAGAMMTLPAGGAAKGASLATKVGRAAATGAGYGFAANPETESTDADPYANLRQRLMNAGVGLGAGTLAEGLVGGTGQFLAKSGEKFADKAVVKQVGANAGQIKKILQKDELPKIGEFLSEEGLMRPGQTLDDVAEKSGKILQDDGPKIAKLYQDAQAEAAAMRSGSEVPMHYDAASQSWKPVGQISGNDLADKIIEKVSTKSKNHPDRNIVNKAIEDAVAPLRDMGENVNIADLHDFRKGLDENINWGTRAQERDAVQRAFIDARNTVADETKGAISALDQTLGGDKMGLLKQLNKRYSAASTVNNISTQGVARETAKAFMGHGVIGAGAGVGAGTLEYKRSGNPIKAGAVGLGTALGVTAARKFGVPFGYYGGKAVQGAGNAIQALTPPPGSMGAGATAPWLLMGDR